LARHALDNGRAGTAGDQDFTTAAAVGQPAGVSPFASTAAAEPPDVSQLAPTEAARTLANWNYDRQSWSHAIEHYEAAIARGGDIPDRSRQLLPFSRPTAKGARTV
jgi:hypothetical protein